MYGRKSQKKTKVFGLKTAIVNKIYDGIQESIKESSLVEIMLVKQGCTCVRREKTKDIMDKYPQILTSSEPPSKMAELKDIGRIG